MSLLGPHPRNRFTVPWFVANAAMGIFILLNLTAGPFPAWVFGLALAPYFMLGILWAWQVDRSKRDSP